ncbi:MAG TPA: VCBS repeat-containing protein [Verrucomicrobiae bacterium]|nr:VCBS repeat-containing protein [Verrucomicrobiae bacterium]
MARFLSVSATLSFAQAEEWRQAEGYRMLPLTVSNAAGAVSPGFTQLSPLQTGVFFTNSLNPQIGINNQILENGAGVALGDVDGDGLCDVFLCGSERPSALYRNLGGWRFSDVTAAAGVACPGQFSTGAAFADVDGDGDLDLLINGIGVGTRLFLNDGHGHFTEDNQSGLARTFGATSLALADVDGDGDLDLYVCNYRTSSLRDEPNAPRPTARRVDGQVVVSPADRFAGFVRSDGTLEVFEKGEPDILYLNNGQGKFKAVSWTGGAFLDETGQPLRAPPEDWGLSVMLRDLNGDGAPDIYVCNDFWHSRDRLWINDGRGRFRAAAPTAWRDMPASSMAIDVADINRDGYDDFLVVEMLSADHRRRQRQRANVPKVEWNRPIANPQYQPEVSRNTLHLARGDGTFAEIAYLAGLAATDWSWGLAFLDVDLDGWEDVLITTGNNHDQMDADMLLPGPGGSQTRGLRHYESLELPNLALRNRHDLTFEEVGAAWGFNATGISQAIALADLDGDGDLDVVINNLNREAWLYRNNATATRLGVRLQGRPPNTRGIGSRIQVTGGPIAQSQCLIAGGRYLSSDDAQRVFAGGPSGTNLTISIRWPSGQASEIRGVSANRLYEVSEPAVAVPASMRTNPPPAPSSPRPTQFVDRSTLLQHIHVDEPFDDFARQPLLERRLSQAGPGVTWFDLDGDGWEDLIVGGGQGGALAVFKSDGHGGFQRLHNPALDRTLTRDQTSVLGWMPARGRLLVGSACYENPTAPRILLQEYDLKEATLKEWTALDTDAASVGPMALADFDGDGDLDLFVGGRVIPGRYPEPASSQIYENDGGGHFQRAPSSSRFTAVGLVSGVVCTDLDGDGDPDLVLACEWGPIRAFLNHRGNFTEATAQLGLDAFKGFWNGVAAGDFDGDGRMDLVASNWGRNSRYQSLKPARLYYADLDGNNTLDLLEAYTPPGFGKLMPWRARDALAKAMPAVGARFTSYRQFAEADIAEILGDRLRSTPFVEVNVLDSMVFLNRGTRFEARPLPIDAQFAPAFGIAVADFDGDGYEDLVLAQNFFANDVETSRFDAGRGLWLRGDGTGQFQAVPGQESGLLIYGEQRGVAAADFDGDGRVDLAVGQNRGPTKLLQNQGARPGVRVRLRGSSGNPAAVGALIRLQFGERWGPARELHAGAGYLSQDGAVQVLATPAPPTRIWVRWPGGRAVTLPYPAGAKEIEIAPDAGIKQIR